MKRAATVLALALTGPLSAAVTMIRLNLATVPVSADPGFTNVTVVGYAFPGGKIAPANVTVTLAPAMPGGGPAGTVAASKVSVVQASQERISFRVPTTIAVSAATSYQVSIAGTTSTGAQFQSSNPSALIVNAALAIATVPPLPGGNIGATYAQALAANGGTGQYSWSVSAGALPSGLLLNETSGTIGGVPIQTGTATFTVQVADTGQATASRQFSLTIGPGAQITSLSPNSASPGLALQVSISGSSTHFVQGTTQADFGPGIVVGSLAIVNATSATAQISIDAAATAGPRTITVSTGTEHATLVNGFTINPPMPYISVNTSAATPLAPGMSGFVDEYLIDGVECWDPKFIAMVKPMKPGWLRYPAGIPSIAFDWQTGFFNQSWISQLQPKINQYANNGIVGGQVLTQAKGGACFAGGTCVGDYAAFLAAVGAGVIVDINGYTDNHPNSAANMAAAARSAGMRVLEWELSDGPFIFPKVFATPAAYLNAMYDPYYLGLKTVDPQATVGVYYQGPYVWRQGNYSAWDNGMTAYNPKYWDAVSFHMYAISDAAMDTVTEEQTLNGILAHGTTEFYNSYLVPLIGSGTPLYITEMNSDGIATMPFESYIYNGIFLAEYISRMSTIPQVKAVGVEALFLANEFNQGMIRAVSDYNYYLKNMVQANPNYTTNTATDPNTQFQFYYSTSALALSVANQAINSSDATWATTVTGGPTVPIIGYDGAPVPAIFAQAYRGTNGTHYLLITNKSGAAVPVAIMQDGNLLPATVAISYVSNASATAQNTATDQRHVQIVTATSPNPVTIGPYSVTRIEW